MQDRPMVVQPSDATVDGGGTPRPDASDSGAPSGNAADTLSRTLSTLLEVSAAMSQQDELANLLESLEHACSALVPHNAMRVYQAERDQQALTLIHASGERSGQAEDASVPFGVGVAGIAAASQRMTRTPPGHTAGSILAVPVTVENDVFSVISLARSNGDPFDERDESLLGILCAHAASEVRRIELGRRNRELYLGGIRALASTVDARDPHTRGHSARVSQMARSLAEELGLSPKDTRRVEVAALLHDIGKVGIPDAILQKAAPLDQHERAVIMGHAELGASILRDAHSESLAELVPLVLHHHEWWDGRGYPRGLSGEEIPLGAQLISIADALDTITHDRPYRQRSAPEDAWVEIQRASGTQFSAAVVEALGRVLDRGSIAHLFEKRRSPDSSTPLTTERAPDWSGQLGDLRALGVMVGLARITSHIADLPQLMQQSLGMLAERLDMSLAMVLRPDPSRREELQAACHSAAGYTVLDCPSPDCLDEVLASPLPASMESLGHIPGISRMRDVFPSMHNVGVVSLASDDEPAGLLMFQPTGNERYWRADVEVIESIAPHVLAAINVARLHERAKVDARTDGLTGAMNYRAFRAELHDCITRASPFSVLMFDVVGLKPVNDTAGHLAGDDMLRRTVDVIRGTVPRDAVVARIGGDEFGVLLPVTTDVDPGVLCGRVSAGMAREVARAHQQPVALRYGWADYPEDGNTASALIHTADQRMYRQHGESGRYDVPRPPQQ